MRAKGRLCNSGAMLVDNNAGKATDRSRGFLIEKGNVFTYMMNPFTSCVLEQLAFLSLQLITRPIFLTF